MPSTSKAQRNFMAAVAHSPAFAKRVGVSQSVGKDFNKADKGRKFEKGGDTMATKKPFPAGLFGGKESKGEEKAEKKAFPTKAGYQKAEAKFEKETPKSALAKHAAKPASKAHAGLKAGGMAKGGGVESKGKTKGKMVTMQKGGKC